MIKDYSSLNPYSMTQLILCRPFFNLITKIFSGVFLFNLQLSNVSPLTNGKTTEFAITMFLTNQIFLLPVTAPLKCSNDHWIHVHQKTRGDLLYLQCLFCIALELIFFKLNPLRCGLFISQLICQFSTGFSIFSRMFYLYLRL